MKDARIQLLQKQIARIDRRLIGLRRRSNQLSWLRVFTFLAGLAVVFLLFLLAGTGWGWLGFAIFLVIFVAIVYSHQRLEQVVARFAGWQRLLQEQVARATLDWPNIPAARQRDPQFEHPFEADLDLVGERSLHRLLDTTATQAGSDRLRAWLSAPIPNAEQTGHRQQLVRELVPLSALRNQLVINGRLLASTETNWDVSRLSNWFEQPTALGPLRAWLIGLTLLAALNLLLVVATVWGLPGDLWRYSLTVYGALYLFHGRAVGEVFQEAGNLRGDLERLLAVFQRLERYGYARTPGLRRLCAPFVDAAQRPSRYLQRLAFIVAATGLQSNPFVGLLLNTVAPWGLFFAYRLQLLKAESAEHMPVWLDTWYEVEALSALANFGWLNPHLPFPTLDPAPTAPIYSVQGLGHPLLPDATKVRNSFSFAQLGEIVILTGSNMAGKSTFLKALGVNFALAYAGGVVDAEALAMPFFRLFTCIKVSDSVTTGVSYFYAEVRRLKALLTALDAPNTLPLFFVIDEIFRGTNNRERLIGSRSYLQALRGKHGVGLIATHDLELVKLADEVPQIANYHFRDEIREAAMYFDYVLRPGPSPTTNALKIMRSAGLPVETADE